MANQIINKIGTSVIHVDTTDGEITMAELKHADEATPVTAKIIEIFYNLKAGASLAIDRGGTDALKITNPASTPTLVGNINYRQAGIVLRGDNTADIGVTLTGTGTRVTIVVHKTH